jgi:peptidoglycan/xylan/chitin deacetylase (PgdA/CDA1 family)
VLSRTKSGSIILLHNGTKNTREALEKILPGLAEKGFKFATVSDLIYKENYIIDHAGTQHPK